MVELISLFERNDQEWKLVPTKFTQPQDIAELLEFDVPAPLTKEGLKKHLEAHIKNLLASEALPANDFDTIQSHIALRYFIADEKQHGHAHTFLRLLRYYIGVTEHYPSSPQQWRKIKSLLEAYAFLCDYDSDKSMALSNNNQNIIIANAAKTLIAKGYNISIKLGRVEFDKDSEERLFEALSYRFNKMGYFALENTLHLMGSFYNRQTKRYYFRRSPSPNRKLEPSIPWGYLFNLSLANLHEPVKSKKLKNWYNECVELAQLYFCIHDLQTFNVYQDMFHTHNTILPAIQKQILYDQHYALDQINAEHMIAMVEGQFASPLVTTKGFNATIHIDLLKWASKQATHDSPLFFTPQQLLHPLGLKYTLDEIEAVLTELSQDAKKLNRGYLQPEDISQRNYFMKPFIKTGEKYCYVNPTLCNFGFYFSLEQKLNPNRKNGNIVGDIAEELVSSLLTKHGVTFYAGKKYKVSDAIRKDLKVESKERECDFIIETDDTIIFLELKRKTLTSFSRAGNTMKSIIDVSQSLFHALAQTGVHEYTLRKQDKITFKDGTELSLNGRNVERVALTLFGYFGLQDGSFVHMIPKTLINARIQSGNEEEDKKANKYLEELRSQYKTDIFQEYYCKDNHNSFFNCRFFSVPQLLTMLKNAKDNETFLTEFNRTRHMTDGSKDWFKEYEYYRKLR